MEKFGASMLMGKMQRSIIASSVDDTVCVVTAFNFAR